MQINEIIKNALAEDLGDGDHSSLSTIPAKAKGSARLLVKEPGIICGIDIAHMVFEMVDSTIEFEQKMYDGDQIKVGDEAFRVHGSSISLLSSERLALNFMQRLSGIATYAAKIVKLVEGTGVTILDTRKTTPLLRELEKYAVKIGGGANHRFGLYDMIMIKDNHVDFSGGIEKAIDAANNYLISSNKDLKIEIEVRNLEELRRVIYHGGIQRVMFDNFSPELMKEAVDLVSKRFETEASGGITEKNIRNYALTGVDFISVGALTHQIKSLDLSLKAI